MSSRKAILFVLFFSSLLLGQSSNPGRVNVVVTPWSTNWLTHANDTSALTDLGFSAWLQARIAPADANHFRPYLALPVIDIRDHPYQAKCDGVTNDAAAIQAAIDAARAAGGGTVVIPGLCAVGSTGWVGILMDHANYVTVRGTSSNAGFHFTHQPTQAIIAGYASALKIIDSNQVRLEGLVFQGNGALDANSFQLVGIEHSEGTKVTDCNFSDKGYTGALSWTKGLGATRCNNTLIHHNRFDTLFYGAVLGNIPKAYPDYYDTNSVLSENFTTTFCACALQVCGENEIFRDNISIGGPWNSGSGVAIVSGGGLYYASFNSKNILVSGNICSGSKNGNGGLGCETDFNGGLCIDRLVCVNNQCYDNEGPGISISFAKNSIIAGNVCWDNGSFIHGAGITLTGILHDVTVDDNHCFNTVMPGTQNGIWCLPTDGNNLSFSNNDCHHNNAYGIWCYADVNVALGRISITNNLVCDNGFVGLMAFTHGTGSIAHLTLANNIVLDNGSGDFDLTGTITTRTGSGNRFGISSGGVAVDVYGTLTNGTAATTQTPGDNSTKLATTAYVDADLVLRRAKESYDLAGYLASKLTAEKLILEWLTPATTELDLSSLHNDFTYQGFAAGDQVAKGFVWSLAGATNKYLWRADDADFTFGNGTNDSPFSVVAWVEVGTAATVQALVGKWNLTTGSEQREWEFRNHTGYLIELRLQDQVHGVGSFRHLDALPANGWHFLVATYDGSGGAAAADGITLYVDGVSSASTAVNNGAYVAMSDTTATETVGAITGMAGIDNYYLGDIGVIAVTGELLSAATVWDIYTATRGKYGL